MNRAIYVIKPEALAHQREIQLIIRDSGLTIIKTMIMELSPEILKALYPNLSKDLITATELYMGGTTSEVGVVNGEGVVQRLLTICRDSTDPRRCAPRTIRRLFGLQKPVSIGTALYFRNAIHRPRTCIEAQRDLAVFASLFNEENLTE